MQQLYKRREGTTQGDRLWSAWGCSHSGDCGCRTTGPNPRTWGLRLLWLKWLCNQTCDRITRNRLVLDSIPKGKKCGRFYGYFFCGVRALFVALFTSKKAIYSSFRAPTQIPTTPFPIIVESTNYECQREMKTLPWWRKSHGFRGHGREVTDESSGGGCEGTVEEDRRAGDGGRAWGYSSRRGIQKVRFHSRTGGGGMSLKPTQTRMAQQYAAGQIFWLFLEESQKEKIWML